MSLRVAMIYHALSYSYHILYMLFSDIDWSKIPLGQLPDRDSEADVIMSDLDCAPAADILENG